MFTKVLVAEDLKSINHGVISVLDKLNIKNRVDSQYCDDAYLKLKRSFIDEEPFQLLITDLSFKKDYRNEELKGGEELITKIKKEYPQLKIIAYSIEDRAQKINSLFTQLKIDAYVCKGRKGLQELEQAILNVYNNKTFLSLEVKDAISDPNQLEIDDLDLEIISALSKGLSQEQISSLLKEKNMSPNSLSTIEKRLNKLRIQFQANNVTHLVSMLKDLGFI